MSQRQACIDSAGCHSGPYFDCGPGGTNVGLCAGVCCAVQQTCLESTCSTTSTTDHTTYSRVELAAVAAYATNVIAKLVDGSGVQTTFDQTYQVPPTSAEVQQAYLAAAQSLTNHSADFVAAPERVAFVQSTTVTFVGEQIDHTEDAVTKTVAACGPQVIQTGADLSDTYLVAPGTQNVNVNTHTETFVNQVYQPSVVEHATYQILGIACR